MKTKKQNRWRGMLCLVLMAFGLAGGTRARTQGIQGDSFDLDFMRPETLKGRIKTFPGALTLSAKGLGYDAEPSHWLTHARFQTTEPIALGRAWAPAAGVTIHASLNVDFAYIGAYSLGQFYARYSSDAAHWSSWQVVMGGARTDKAALTHIYEGQIIVPDVEREPYFDLLRQFNKAQPEQANDEEMAARWIVKQDPHYFDKTMPYIGYIEFLFEMPLEGSQHIKALHCDVIWSLPGLHMTSKREQEARKNNTMLRWSYRAAPDNAKPASEKEKDAVSQKSKPSALR